METRHMVYICSLVGHCVSRFALENGHTFLSTQSHLQSCQTSCIAALVRRTLRNLFQLGVTLACSTCCSQLSSLWALGAWTPRFYFPLAFGQRPYFSRLCAQVPPSMPPRSDNSDLHTAQCKCQTFRSSVCSEPHPLLERFHYPE